MLAIVLVAVFSVRTAILISIVPGLLAVAAMAYAIAHIPKKEGKPTAIRFQFGTAFRSVRSLFVSVGAFEIGNVAATLLILRATELLDTRWSLSEATTGALVLYVGYNVAATAASVVGGRWLDARSAIAVLRAGFLAFGIAYGIFAISGGSVPFLATAFMLAGIGIGLVETAEHAAVAHAAPMNIRGSAFGLLAGLQSLGNLAASSVAGILWTAASPSWAFAYLATWMVIALTSSAFGIEPSVSK